MSLADLFPNLPGDVIREFENPGANSGQPLDLNGEQAAVTDDQVAAYLQSIGSLRAPLKPVVEGQSVPDQPQFYRNGRQAPPAHTAITEEPDMGTGVPAPSVPDEIQPPPPVPGDPEREYTPPPVPTTPAPTQTPPPVPQPDQPAPTPPATPPTDQVTISGRAYSQTELEGLQQLNDLWRSDPNLQKMVASYLTTGQVPGQLQQQQLSPQQQPAPVPPQPYPPTVDNQPLPNDAHISEEDLSDPAIRVLYAQQQQTNEQLRRLQANAISQQQQHQANEMDRYTQLVEGAVSSFKDKFQVPDDLMQQVRQVAGRTGIATAYMNGIHPVTGAPVKPDPTMAAMTALTQAYHMIPEARELERARDRQRTVYDTNRKAKLAGIGGSSGSAPRTPDPQPTARQSMVDEVNQMFNGSWTGAN